MCLSGLWAAALLACCVDEHGPTVWDLMTKSPAEQREIQARLRKQYVWVEITLRLRKIALAALILGVVLYAIGK